MREFLKESNETEESRLWKSGGGGAGAGMVSVVGEMGKGGCGEDGFGVVRVEETAKICGLGFGEPERDGDTRDGGVRGWRHAGACGGGGGFDGFAAVVGGELGVGK